VTLVPAAVPGRLHELVRADQAGPVRPRAMAFSPERWIDRAPEHAATFSSLPELLDRESVRAFCARQHVDEPGAMRIFIASQVWGYGGVGYGPFRLSEALADQALPARLAQSRAEVRAGRPVDGFRVLCVEHESPWVGTAFGSKFLHFADPDGRALILDAVVAGWLRKHAGLSFRCLRDEREYAAWLEIAAGWGSEFNLAPERIELLIFTAGLPEKSQWRSES